MSFSVVNTSTEDCSSFTLNVIIYVYDHCKSWVCSLTTRPWVNSRDHRGSPTSRRTLLRPDTNGVSTSSVYVQGTVDSLTTPKFPGPTTSRGTEVLSRYPRGQGLGVFCADIERRKSPNTTPSCRNLVPSCQQSSGSSLVDFGTTVPVRQVRRTYNSKGFSLSLQPNLWLRSKWSEHVP